MRADWREDRIVIGAGGWMVPIGEKMFRVGSTYEWDELDGGGTTAGRERVGEIAIALGGNEFEVIDHVAGVRPIMRCSQPVIGRTKAGAWFLNGLGSKGALYAPGAAKYLADAILEGRQLPDYLKEEEQD